ncbi:hypothetical protein [uncultured Microbacterium sp.]|uniref:hypothetical protein n=1 Tax=uncultured Microbacterium sp. TaxID=191216 RepID=UPI00095E7A70|nr:hypothetical protein [uncultured Microbacterium sp.]MBN9141094.1 hypothetical protein [Micrococcales bacterium]OJX69714.1 MAG: hypothetical protein BGO94_14675 [Micrococcales bacterium 72-143]
MIELLGASIGGASLVLAAVLPVLLSTRKRAGTAAEHARTAAEQTTNSHESNLRDDLDEKHSENAGRIGKLERRLGGVERGVRRIEEHLAIEQTMPAPPRRKRP